MLRNHGIKKKTLCTRNGAIIDIEGHNGLCIQVNIASMFIIQFKSKTDLKNNPHL
jgi:hypothetical protein